MDSTLKYRTLRSHSIINHKAASFSGISVSRDIEELIISKTSLINFVGFPKGQSFQSLISLRCDNSKISSFKGAAPLPSLKFISLINSPISHYTHYRLMTIIAFGPSLELIDHSPIRKGEKTFYSLYKDLLFPFISQGWILTMLKPIKIYHPETRERRVLYLKNYINNNNANNKSDMFSNNSANNSPTSKSISSRYQHLDDSIIEGKTSNNVDFLKFLERNFFEDINNLRNKSLNLKEIKNDINNDFSLFIFFVLNAVNLRPLYIRNIVSMLKDVQQLTKSSNLSFSKQLLNQIPLFPFFTYSILSNFLEYLLLFQVLKESDVRPFFFSVYDKFEDWETQFTLFEDVYIYYSDKNRIEENGFISKKKGESSIRFIDFFCIFSRVIERTDNDLFINLLNEMSEEENRIYQNFKENEKEKEKIWDSLAKDDENAFNSYSDDQIKQCVIELTPWDVSDSFGQDKCTLKLASAAFGGAKKCFDSALKENCNYQELDEVVKCASFAGGNAEIYRNFISYNQENESQIEEMSNNDDHQSEDKNKKYERKFEDLTDEELALIMEYSEIAIKYHRISALKEICPNPKFVLQSLSKKEFIQNNSEISSENNENNSSNSNNENIGNNNDSNKKGNIDNKSFVFSLFADAVDSMEINAISYFIEKEISFDAHFLLDKAILLGHLSFVRFLNDLGFKSENALNYAVQSQTVSIVRFFIKNENLINHKGSGDRLNWTPLHTAAYIGNLSIINALLSSPAIDINSQDIEGNTPLTIAVSNNFSRVVEKILKSKVIYKNQQNYQTDNTSNHNENDKDTPNNDGSINNVNNNKNKAVSDICNENFVDINKADHKGWTPLLIAVGNRNREIVKMLLNYSIMASKANDKSVKIDVNCQTTDGGETPLIAAVEVGDLDIFRDLLNGPYKNEIDVNKKTKTIIVENSNETNGVSSQKTSIEGETALSLALKKKLFLFVDLILASGKINTTQSANGTAEDILRLAKECGAPEKTLRLIASL